MSLRRNVLNLFAVQVISYLVPLLQLPYLSRVLGVDGFGLYIFSYSLIAFLSVITNFGFDVYLPQKIAAKKIEGIELSRILTGTLVVRSSLFLLAASFVIIFSVFNDDLDGKNEIIGAIIFSVFSNAYTSLWIYQAKECIYIYVRITLIAKMLSMLLIYFFVSRREDIGLAIFFVGIGNFFSLLLSNYLACKKFSIKIEKTSWSSIFELIKDSFDFFVSRIFVSFYVVSGGIILGAFSGNLSEVAFYGAAQQLYAAGIYALSAISTPLAPYMARTKNLNLFFKVTALAICLALLGSAFGVIWGDELIVLIFGESMKDAKSILDVFMVTAFFSVLGLQFGYPALQPIGMVKYANRSVVIAGGIQVLLVGTFLLTGIEINALNIAFSYLLCDVFLSFSRLAVFIKFYRGKNAWNNNII